MSESRRNLFSRFLKPLRAKVETIRPVDRQSPWVRTDKVAIIQGRHCLAYQESYCSVCYERCPVPQAIEFDDGLPRIIPETCTGCGICHDVCPAPQNAILIADRKPGLGA